MRTLESILRAVDTSDLPTVEDARDAWVAFRQGLGYAGDAALLTPPDAQAKLGKGMRELWSLTIAQADMAGIETCPMRTAECTQGCVMVSGGKGKLDSVRDARIARTWFAELNPRHFLALLRWELTKLQARARAARRRIRVRLNAASDIRWELVFPELFAIEWLDFYDYTKWPLHLRNVEGLRYRVVYSYTGHEAPGVVAGYLAEGRNVAVVVDAKRYRLPAELWGVPMVDGDKSDDRYADPHGVVVGLALKGDEAAALRGSPFVVSAA